MATTYLSKEFINEQYNCLNGIYKLHSLMGCQAENLMVDTVTVVVIDCVYTMITPHTRQLGIGWSGVSIILYLSLARGNYVITIIIN